MKKQIQCRANCGKSFASPSGELRHTTRHHPHLIKFKDWTTDPVAKRAKRLDQQRNYDEKMRKRRKSAAMMARWFRKRVMRRWKECHLAQPDNVSVNIPAGLARNQPQCMPPAYSPGKPTPTVRMLRRKSLPVGNLPALAMRIGYKAAGLDLYGDSHESM